MIVFEFYKLNDPATENGTLNPVDEFLTSFGYRPAAFYTDYVNPKGESGVYNALYVPKSDC